MAKNAYRKVWHNCATCRFWNGPREAGKDRETVTVNGSAIGQCQGFWQGQRKYSVDKCTEWALWEELAGEPDEAEKA